MVDITVRIQNIEQDHLEGLPIGNIARNNGFGTTGALRDFLLGQKQQALWSKINQAAVTARQVQVHTRHQDASTTTPRKEAEVTTLTEANEPYGQKIWRYIQKAEGSPKKRTAAKAVRLKEEIRELIRIVDAEAEEVEALKKIADLEEQLRAERAKLKPANGSTSTPSERDYDPKAVRAWAKESDIVVPERGKIADGIVKAYKEAQHLAEEGKA